ncbi:putative addiction module CopG family antidote [Stella humosa]|uniref:Putative addiction module CopG family antidote n=1 Tax=Stella humosa TaxID=94 RepID=A0A3N1KRA6_9PROT|nr:type II toxin-antitoxin system ParD family antitoxin [Stella humosa]ROP80868.1 putative addiction module CopG family antidote [Stella humosa]BBK33339.1 hypothetical protein STHU_39730 [Stella humosa]
MDVATITRSFTISDEHDRLIDELIADGRYKNPRDVIAAALNLIEEQEIRRAALHAAIDVGVKEIERGEGISFDDIKDLEAYLIQITDPILNRGKPG